VKSREWWFWNVRHRLYWRFNRRSGRVHGRGPLLVAIGDSLTSPFTGFTLPWQIWLRRVGREGYRTLNLGVGGQTTADMRGRVEQCLSEGIPEIAVVFAGNVDAERGVEPAETERNVVFMIEWLRQHGVDKIVLIGPALQNLPRVPDYMSHVTDWYSLIGPLRAILRNVAAEHEVVFIDLAQLLRDRISRGDDPDFSRVPYRPSRSWHAVSDDAHFNAYGHRLVAEAFVAATAQWRPATRARWAPSRGRQRSVSQRIT
jgi:lysophospholipase L1-like esterase